MLVAALFVSGVVMAFFGYVPAAEQAHKSVADITASSLSGIRSAHSLVAEVFLVMIFLHMTRIAMTRSWHGDRKKNWHSGILLLCVASLFFYTGITLKWDQQGYEAFDHIVMLAGLAGLKGLFAGSGPTKMFVIHAVVLPLLLAGILGGHMMLVKINGISPLAPGDDNAAGPQTTFLHHIRHVAAYGLILLGVVHLVAAYYTPPLLGEPFAGVEWTKPAWPFLFLYPLETWALVVVPLIAIAVLAIIPFLANPLKKWDASQALFFILVMLWAALTFFGAVKHFA